MRKYGNFKRHAEPKANSSIPAKKVNTKQPKVKNVLLRTYFTSLLCMILCVAMFFGTSYAWFTSEVNNPANEIYVGTLAVGLLKETNTEDQDLSNDDVKLFNSDIRWEPGYTALEKIKVVNKGDLAFKYVMTFTDGTLDDTSDMNVSPVAKYFDVWVFDHLDKTYVAPGSYKDITEDSDWKYVGTLAEVLEGKTVLSGNMVTVRQEGQESSKINAGTTDGKRTEDSFTIALHMKETATADVMGHKIGLNVKLVAYQMPSEKDAFSNSNYDEYIALAANAEELKSGLVSGTNVVLSSNIALTNVDECVTMKAALLDGNGKTITYSGTDKAVDVVTTSGGKISNLSIHGTTNGCALYVEELASDLVVSDCTFSGASAFNLNSTTKNDEAIMSFLDTSFTSGVSYANVANHAYFTNCTFDGILKPCGDTTLANCTFTTAGLDVSALEAGEVITLVNCTYYGTLVEKAVLTSNGTVVIVDQSNAIMVNAADEMVVLSGNE